MPAGSCNRPALRRSGGGGSRVAQGVIPACGQPVGPEPGGRGITLAPEAGSLADSRGFFGSTEGASVGDTTRLQSSGYLDR